ncbi:hypothetical protein [Achromobacter sp. DH1f]|uniref:hypothetical protein n=1 Tax=Achromobacter sp. DH1f TaxID=1397275 RepID=UPI00046A4AED|nr:hypothetical protein [Achromobacter sp. DH1f]
MISALGSWIASLGQYSLKHEFAVRAFQSRRADFYEGLCDKMEATAGKKTLQNILQDDCERNGGVTTTRGYLSDYLATRLVTDGQGKLSETLRDIVPDEDVMILAVAEMAGPGALEQCLRDLTDYTRLLDRVKSAFTWTILAGGITLLMFVGMLFVIAYGTYPRLADVFGSLPLDMWRGAASSLRRTALFLQGNLVLILGLSGVIVYLLHWSLRNFVGPWREKVEDQFIWRVFRDFQSIRFLMTLAVILKPRQGNTINMRDGILLLDEPRNPWLSWHIQKMLAKIEEEHLTGAETFDTGILPKSLYHTLADVCVSHGVDVGLQRTRRQVEVRVLGDVAKRATVAKWTMFAISIAGLIGIAMWHFSAIENLKRALQLFYMSS